MRISVSFAVLAVVLAFGAAVHAQEPIAPYETEVQAPPPAPPPPPAQIPVPQPIDPYSAYPAPPAYGYQHPSAGPGVVPAAPPSYQQGYYLYPAQGSAPVYYAPPPGAYRGCCCCSCQAPSSCYVPPRVVAHKKWDGVRRFSLGAHAAFLTLNQRVGSDDVTLGGGGFQLRLR